MFNSIISNSTQIHNISHNHTIKPLIRTGCPCSSWFAVDGVYRFLGDRWCQQFIAEAEMEDLAILTTAVNKTEFTELFSELGFQINFEENVQSLEMSDIICK